MNKIIFELLLFVGLISVVVFSILFMSKQSEIFYKKMNEFEKLAREAKTRDELRKIWTELVTYAKKEAYCRHYGDRVRQIISYMQGKYEGLS